MLNDAEGRNRHELQRFRTEDPHAPTEAATDAREAGRSNRHVSLLPWAHTRVASLETLVKICNVLDTNPGYLLAASLTCDTAYTPTGLTPEVKEKLCTLLFLAHEVVMNTPADPAQN